MIEEHVLVVARDLIPDRAKWHGLRTDGLGPFLQVAADHAEFRPRRQMESDPAWKQLIPYLVIRDGERYFLMRRTRAGGDPRLHDRWSIGAGGHVNPGDDDLTGGLVREWREELDADFEPTFRPVALLNDDSTDVGSVHLGVVVVADALGRSVRVRETDKLVGSFVPAVEVAAVRDDLETWSQIIFDAMERGEIVAPTRVPG